MYYWKLQDAVEELRKRRENLRLREEVNEFLRECPIQEDQEELNGFLARHVVSARLEDEEFESRCLEAGLRPINLEYASDRFCTNNPSKMRLVRLRIFEGYGKNGGPRLRTVFVVDRAEKLNGQPLYQIKTKWGEFLSDFHHRAREVVGLKGGIIEVSEWLRGFGRARDYYRYLLTACVTRGILFEAFDSPGFPDLDVFNREVVIPAWQWVMNRFGCSPLIVRHPLTSSPEEEERILNWYPSGVLDAIPEEYRI